ncbi:hypothetical protein IFM89_035022 [Coptis chinensis]|uniref:F-box domain-containing protein n=1 Tax=Coptis chinensis TaxID=261450 RepID=A0A835LSL8_9MAGN|nr:hypothetical protein IFM89_035022 [Coptis chinensis]
MEKECKESESTSSHHTMTPGSSKKQILNQERLSHLPEEILHKIFSFLDMKEVIETSIFSKRYRYSWNSVHTLNFDLSLWKKHLTSPSDLNRFIPFVYHVLSLRRSGGANNIQKLSITCSDSFEGTHFNNWIDIAIHRHVQEIEIYVHSDQEFEVNPSIFTSEVKIFKLRADLNSSAWFSRPIKLPLQMCLAEHLNTLELVSVALPKGDEVTMNCPVLENLIIRKSYQAPLKSFTICAVQLKKLNIDNSFITRRLYIRCEKLVRLKYIGSMSAVSLLENLNAVINAEICVALNTRKMKEEAANAKKVIAAMPNAKCLVFKGLEVFLKIPNSLDSLLIPLRYLRNLKLLPSSRDRACIYGMAHVLKGCPLLEKLAWESVESSRITDGGVYTSFPSEFVLSRLKIVKAHVVQGRVDELEFLTFLLENAPGLRKMTIDTDTNGQIVHVDEFEFLTFLLKNAVGLRNMTIDTCTGQISGEREELQKFKFKADLVAFLFNRPHTIVSSLNLYNNSGGIRQIWRTEFHFPTCDG